MLLELVFSRFLASFVTSFKCAVPAWLFFFPRYSQTCLSTNIDLNYSLLHSLVFYDRVYFVVRKSFFAKIQILKMSSGDEEVPTAPVAAEKKAGRGRQKKEEAPAAEKKPAAAAAKRPAEDDEECEEEAAVPTKKGRGRPAKGGAKKAAKPKV